MNDNCKAKLDNVIFELSNFLEKDFSSKFKTLSQKEDRQLFFLARTLVQLRQIANNLKTTENVVLFPPSRVKH